MMSIDVTEIKGTFTDKFTGDKVDFVATVTLHGLFALTVTTKANQIKGLAMVAGIAVIRPNDMSIISMIDHVSGQVHKNSIDLITERAFGKDYVDKGGLMGLAFDGLEAFLTEGYDGNATDGFLIGASCKEWELLHTAG